MANNQEKLFILKINHTFALDGSSLWINKQNYPKQVKITQLRLSYYTDEDDVFGEVRAYFKVSDWDVRQHGLIYTDHGFMDNLKKHLLSHNIPTDIHYSEQGMQGKNYVSMDADEQIIKYFLERV